MNSPFLKFLNITKGKEYLFVKVELIFEFWFPVLLPLQIFNDPNVTAIFSKFTLSYVVVISVLCRNYLLYKKSYRYFIPREE